MKTKSTSLWLLAAFLLIGGGLAAAAQPEAGPAVEVAPQVKGTFMQAMPGVAWSEKARCWLVVWREGELNTLDSNIWCARVSADGKTLDAAGVRISAAADAQDLPRVASDGDGFLVVWQDYRNGKDWDVYAARVSAGGKVLDPDGFPVAKGAHNQCLPDVAFAAGNYYIAWMGFEEKVNQYSVFGARVSPAGKVLDHPAVRLLSDPKRLCVLPALAARGGDVFLAASRTARQRNGSAYLRISGATGRPAGPVSLATGAREQALGSDVHLALGPKGGLSVHGNRTNVACVMTLDPSGKLDQKPVTFLPVGAPAYHRGCFYSPQRRSVAWDGTGFLCVMDWHRTGERGKNDKSPDVIGWRLAADGKPLAKDPFVVAEGDVCQDQSQIAAGSAGACLAVYRERRGTDNCKIMARVVKTK